MWEQIDRNFVMSRERLLKVNVVYFILSLLKALLTAGPFASRST